MKDGLEEFLKRIEQKPTNETLIDRFVTLVLEEEILERIFYLKKMVGLLLNSNPYAALKAAALELQEARKENMTREYELGALKDVESCFLKLDKQENVQFIREEINKLSQEATKTIAKAAPPRREVVLPKSIPIQEEVRAPKPSEPPTPRAKKAPEPVADVEQFPISDDQDESAPIRTTKMSRPPPSLVEEYSFNDSLSQPMESSRTHTKASQGFDASLSSFEPQTEHNLNYAPSHVRKSEPEQERTRFDMQPAPDDTNGDLAYERQSEPKQAPLEFDADEEESTKILHGEEVEAAFTAAESESNTSASFPSETSFDPHEPLAQLDLYTLSSRTRKNSVPLEELPVPKPKSASAETRSPEIAMPKPQRASGKTLSGIMGGSSSNPAVTAGPEPTAAMAPLPSAPGAVNFKTASPTVAPDPAYAPLASPSDFNSPQVEDDLIYKKGQESSGAKPMISEPETIGTGPVVSEHVNVFANLSSPAALASASPSPLAASHLDRQLHVLSGGGQSEEMDAEAMALPWDQLSAGIKMLCAGPVTSDWVAARLGGRANEKRQQQGLDVLSKFIGAADSVKYRAKLMAWIFEELEAESIHELWTLLHMNESAPHFFTFYIGLLIDEQQYRRALNVIHLVLQPDLEHSWYRKSYSLLSGIWERLGLKAWYWQDSEGSEAFCRRLHRREDLLPLAMMGCV